MRSSSRLQAGAAGGTGAGWWASLGNAARVTAGYAPPLQHTLRQRLNISAQSFPLNEYFAYEHPKARSRGVEYAQPVHL